MLGVDLRKSPISGSSFIGELEQPVEIRSLPRTLRANGQGYSWARSPRRNAATAARSSSGDQRVAQVGAWNRELGCAYLISIAQEAESVVQPYRAQMDPRQAKGGRA